VVGVWPLHCAKYSKSSRLSLDSVLHDAFSAAGSNDVVSLGLRKASSRYTGLHSLLCSIHCHPPRFLVPELRVTCRSGIPEAGGPAEDSAQPEAGAEPEDSQGPHRQRHRLLLQVNTRSLSILVKARSTIGYHNHCLYHTVQAYWIRFLMTPASLVFCGRHILGAFWSVWGTSSLNFLILQALGEGDIQGYLREGGEGIGGGICLGGIAAVLIKARYPALSEITTFGFAACFVGHMRGVFQVELAIRACPSRILHHRGKSVT